MIDITSLLVSPPIPGAPPPVAVADGTSFASTLADLLDPATSEATDGEPNDDERQIAADPGKVLPDALDLLMGYGVIGLPAAPTTPPLPTPTAPSPASPQVSRQPLAGAIDLPLPAPARMVAVPLAPATASTNGLTPANAAPPVADAKTTESSRPTIAIPLATDAAEIMLPTTALPLDKAPARSVPAAPAAPPIAIVPPMPRNGLVQATDQTAPVISPEIITPAAAGSRVQPVAANPAIFALPSGATLAALSPRAIPPSPNSTPAQARGDVVAPPPAAAPTAPIPEAPLVQPAGRAFAVAIAAAAGVRPRAAPEERDDAPAAGLSAATTAAALPDRFVVAPPADARHAALDPRQDRGVQGMIDRIELLRDDSNARDTRIRLVPDALGAVDIAVRKDGDVVHVHFTTENRTAAALIADAQPRLGELAEARGVRLGQTSVGTGSDGNAAGRQPPQPATPRAPASPGADRDPRATDNPDYLIA